MTDILSHIIGREARSGGAGRESITPSSLDGAVVRGVEFYTQTKNVYTGG